MQRKRMLNTAITYGVEIFGTRFPRNHQDALRWIADKAAQGCLLSRRLLENSESQADVLGLLPLGLDAIGPKTINQGSCHE